MALKDLTGVRISFNISGQEYTGILVDIYLRKYTRNGGVHQTERFVILTDSNFLIIRDVGDLYSLRYIEDEYLDEIKLRLRKARPLDKKETTREELIDLEG